ncbi:MAG: hypothetical protein ABI778_10015, partial [Ignavibacteriota bacterium]
DGKERIVRVDRAQRADLLHVVRTAARKGPRFEDAPQRLKPSQPVIAKLRNEYRWHILIKDNRSHDQSGEKIRRLLTGSLEQYQRRFANSAVTVTVDVDVQGVL